ncbi:alpha/beta hydrolase [Botrimarina hoheduenensis]|uniref:alpha/beta hydrolase n=1 Tax=Botrimarina hoheduenensis TaxID=2528000 RepID=UPI0011B7FF97|nr:alpha/beta hydrolase-fold protein [Botrimarina hoheduenensis]
MSRFRTIEVSDPAYESAGLRFLTVKTPSLQGRGDICVFVPRGVRSDEVLPIVILLHGVYGSHWSWSQKAGVHLTAQRMIDAGQLPRMLLAMPSDGLMFDGTAYLPHNGRRFDDWIVRDVPAAMVEAGLPTSLDAMRFIAGLSMGGYGALRLAAKHPEYFAAFAAHSAITEFVQMGEFVEEDLDDYGCGDDERSAFGALAASAIRLPPFRFDCGIDDTLIDANRALHQRLLDINLPHIYVEHPGGHDWAYWATHVATTLRFFGDQLKA